MVRFLSPFLRGEAVHLPLDDVVEDVVDGRVRVAQVALRRAHGLHATARWLAPN